MADFQSVKSTRITAAGAVNDKRTRLTGIYFVGAAAAGSIVIRNGGASGTILLTIDTPASVAFGAFIDFGDGVLFPTDCYVSAITAGVLANIIYSG